ncbi:MAG: FKBP-type peptidyl-prolyl cis-trans isomerase [Chitinophagaceae bacterium]|nr:MAG: FKBP-type peptidyl-prolyl cis-trans isomerase [Chitinophagaceae bacterium]
MYFKTLFPAAILGLLLVGCKEQGFKKTKGGMPYKLITKSGAAKVKSNEWLKINYVVSIKVNGKDSVLQSTYAQGAPYYMPATSQTQPYDISEIIPMLHKGDSVIAVQSMDTFIKRSPQMVPPFFKKGGTLTTTLRVLDVFPTQEAAREDDMKTRDAAFKGNTKVQTRIKEDQQKIRDFLGASAASAQQTPSGTYVVVTSQGSGAKAEKGNYVEVFYTGRTLQGTMFDSNIDTSFHHTDPLAFQLGKGQMLQGFDEAIQLLKQGDKARVLIPSPLAYGENAPPGGKIGPNEILLFDVELRAVSADDPRAKMVPPGAAGGADPHGH